MSKKKEKATIFRLIGPANPILEGRKLPTNRQVLQLFFYKHSNLKLGIRLSARQTVDEVFKKWSLIGIPVAGHQYSTSKVEKLHSTWVKLQKSVNKTSSTQRKNEENFEISLNSLFDVAQRDVLDVLTDDKKLFLDSQRSSSRRGFIPTRSPSPESLESAVGVPLQDRESGDENNNDSASAEASCSTSNPSLDNEPEEEAHEESQDLSQSLKKSLSFPSSTESSSPQLLERIPSNFEDELDKPPPPKKQKIINMDVAATCDRIAISNSAATLFTGSILRGLGLNVDDYNFSDNTFRRRRMAFREKMADQLKSELKLAKCLVLHWDGKLLPAVDGNSKIDRLPIVVTGFGTEQLLGAPALDSGTGRAMVDAIMLTLNEWNLTDRVTAICFDTTSSNTGCHTGACTLLEQRLQKSLLHLAGRHHVAELMLRAVVEVHWPVTSGPHVPMFQRFKQEWDQIDETAYQIGMDDESTAEILHEHKDDILVFIEEQFKGKQPRGDYQEFLELACIFLGGIPPRGIKFKRPGANHHARWLAKAIYCLKIFIFRAQFFQSARSSREVTKLRQICIFIILFYVKIWFNAPYAITAPQQDLSLMQRLIQFQVTHPNEAKAALGKLRRHLWYLTEKLAVLAFFDPTVPNDTKLKMVHAIKDRESPIEQPKRIELSEGECQVLLEIDISNFINKNSMQIFELFDLPHDFLNENPVDWNSNQSYHDCLEIFQNLKVVNDVAERGVSLAEHYTGLLTKNEEQYQHILQVVKAHRQRYPNSNKRNFIDIDDNTRD